MINDYRKEVIKPIDIKGKKFLYRSVEVAPIPKPTDTSFTGIERTEAEAQKAVEDLIDDIQDIEVDYDAIIREILKLEDAYTTSAVAPAYDEDAKRVEYTAMTNPALINLIKFRGYTMPKTKNKVGYVNKLIENEMREKGSSPDDIKAQIDKLDLDAKECIDNIRRRKGQIRQFNPTMHYNSK